MRTTEEVQLLLDYLRELNNLYNCGFRVSKEINRCVKEIEKGLVIQRWDKAKEYRVAAGTSIFTEPGDGSKLSIDENSKMIVIPE
ncbi:hypothetical protein HP398_29745 [Brevibacillus sp. HB1.4B]|uniref:hypothetical protein n=1 Tax=Brevibacillus sp. HB1.4B TaxID=2738845 RepID=UPI00156BCF63|nr:hypothetical protein [Brevibacillus sp. HB1.4B]NRS20606.1 hypothetical protein [Brevibacillus sp. HB1.4B]